MTNLISDHTLMKSTASSEAARSNLRFYGPHQEHL